MQSDTDKQSFWDRRYALADQPEWQKLLRHFDLSNDFALLILLLPDFHGTAVCRDALERRLAIEQQHLVRLEFSTPEKLYQLPTELLKIRPEKDTGCIWISTAWTDESPDTDSSAWREAWKVAMSRLNPYRNTLRKQFDRPLLLVGAPWLQETIRDLAPDLWSVRTLVARIEPKSEIRGSIDAEQYLPLPPPVFESSPVDPNFALAEAEKLRSKPGKELDLAKVLIRAAHNLTQQQKWVQAEPCYREALALREQFRAEPTLIAETLSELAQLLADSGTSTSEPEQLIRRALKINEKFYGSDHPKIAENLNNLALLLQDTNRLDEAEPLFRRALDINISSFGPQHPNVAISLNNLALLLQDTNRLKEAETLFRRALDINETSLGPQHINIATSLNNLAKLCKDTYRYKEAEKLFRRALDINETSLEPQHPDTATVLNNLAKLLQTTNRLEEAEKLFRRALDIDEKFFREQHPTVAKDLNNLAMLLKDTNRLHEAEPLLRRAFNIFTDSLGQDDPQTMTVAKNLEILQAEIAT